MFKSISTIATAGILSFTPIMASADAYGYIGAGYGQYKFEFEEALLHKSNSLVSYNQLHEE